MSNEGSVILKYRGCNTIIAFDKQGLLEVSPRYSPMMERLAYSLESHIRPVSFADYHNLDCTMAQLVQGSMFKKS